MKWIPAIGAVLTVPTLAFGAASFSLTEGGTGVFGTTAISVNPGDSFTIDLGVAQEDTNGCTLFGGALEASTSGIFYLTSRSFSLSGIYWEAVEDEVLLRDDHKWLSPQALNFGALCFNSPFYWPWDEFPSVVSTFTLQTPPDAPPGVYTIFTGAPGGGIYISDWQGNEPGQTPVTIGTIQVTIRDCPMVDTAVSYKEHGPQGEFGINVLDRTGDDDVECRCYGATKLVVGFDMAIQGVGGLDTSDVLLTSGTVDTVALSAADELTIEMSGTTNAEPLTVTFPGIANVGDVSAVCAESVCIRQVVGDVRSDTKVNSLDRIELRNNIDAPVTVDNFRADVRADGEINSLDRIELRNNMDTSFVGSCP